MKAEPHVEEPASGDVLVATHDLRVWFDERPSLLERAIGGHAPVRAVDGVDLEIRRGEILGIVGESGSGKTTLGRALLHLTHITAGEALFDGQPVGALRGESLRRFRRRAQMIFQDSHGSLSPRKRVASLLTEPYLIDPTIPAAERFSVEQLLDLVGLARNITDRYPNTLSGGQARRVGIARVLALRPQFIVADEPTAGLDMSAAAGILNLMKELGERLGLTYLVITHNLAMLGYLADRVAVMYLGRVVEAGPTARVMTEPAHPYTQALLAAFADSSGEVSTSPRDLLLPGEIPSPRFPPSGCAFHTRCTHVQERSRTERPVLETTEPGHQVACHHWREVRRAIASERLLTER